jgi:hypothetical protein
MKKEENTILMRCEEEREKPGAMLSHVSRVFIVRSIPMLN